MSLTCLKGFLHCQILKIPEEWEKDKLSIDLKMAWRNIWRNLRRTIITISAIAFACVLLVFMLSFQLGGYETMINSSVKIHSGHPEIQAQGYNDKQNIRMVIHDPKKR